MANKNHIGNKIKSLPQFSIVFSLLVILLFFSLTAEGFLSARNFIGVFRQSIIPLCVAIGMTFVLISGEIDLSVGSVANLSGTIMAGLMAKNGFSPLLAIFCGLALGTLLGGISGSIISRVKVPSFIVTLSMMITARGLSLVYSNARPITGISDAMLRVGRGSFLGIPILVIIGIVLIIISIFVLVKMNFGRHIFAVGGNQECARLSGIRIEITKTAVFAISGFCAALTGMVMVMRFASSQPTMGESLELDAIASAVLGGTSINGGKGDIIGTIVGCLFLMFLTFSICWGLSLMVF